MVVVRPDIRLVQDIVDIVIEFKYLKLVQIGKTHVNLTDMSEDEFDQPGARGRSPCRRSVPGGALRRKSQARTGRW